MGAAISVWKKPAAASACAIAKPNPREVPDTRATRPSSENKLIAFAWLFVQ
jgi:hypothetical protein